MTNFPRTIGFAERLQNLSDRLYTLERRVVTIVTRRVPAGTITMYGASSAPGGWLLCNGQTVSQTTYANLFAVIGTTYNTGGEAGGDFRLPDLRSRVPIGAGTYAALGTGDSLAEAVRTPQHLHTAGTLANSSVSLGQQVNTTTGGGSNRLTSPDSHTHTISGSTGTTAANALPHLALRFIIRT